MLNFLGVESNFSVLAGMPWESSFFFRNDADGTPFNLDGLTFKGSVFVKNREGETEEHSITFITSEEANTKHILEMYIPELPEGRHRYAITATESAGTSCRLLSGFVTSLDKLPTLSEGDTYNKRTLLLRMPGDAGKQLEVQWMTTTISQFYAHEAKGSADEAALSAEDAAESAKQAAASESAAAESEKQAAASASAAAKSAAAAKTSETAASKSESAAKASENKAKSYAEAAEQSNSSANTNANRAEKAAEASKASATKSETESTAAKAAAKEAAASQKAAAASADAASQSASDAAASAIASASSASDAEKSTQGIHEVAAEAAQSAKEAETAEKKATTAYRRAISAANRADAAVNGDDLRAHIRDKSLHIVGGNRLVTGDESTQIANGDTQTGSDPGHGGVIWFELSEKHLSECYLKSITVRQTYYTSLNVEDIQEYQPLPLYFQIWERNAGDSNYSMLETAKAEYVQGKDSTVDFKAAFCNVHLSGRPIRIAFASNGSGDWDEESFVKIPLRADLSADDDESWVHLWNEDWNDYAEEYYCPSLYIETYTTQEILTKESGGGSLLPERNNFEQPVIGNKAKGSESSIALGYSATASGQSSIALGRGTEVSADNAIAIGNYATNVYNESFQIQLQRTGDLAPTSIFFYGPTSSLASHTGGEAGMAYDLTGGKGDMKFVSLTDLFSGGGVKLPAGNNLEQPVIGTGATGTGPYSVAIGKNATGAELSSVAIGSGATGAQSCSVAIGSGATGAGLSSVAIGDGAKGTEISSVAIGDGAKGTGTWSVAIGDGATGNGSFSVAIGNGASVDTSAASSIAVGDCAKARGKKSIAIGNSAASGNYSIALGQSTVAQEYGTALGDDAEAGQHSVAVGSSAIANGDGNNVAIGDGASALGEGGVAIGQGATVSEGSGGIAIGQGALAETGAINLEADSLSLHVYGRANADCGEDAPVLTFSDMQAQQGGISLAALADLSKIFGTRLLEFKEFPWKRFPYTEYLCHKDIRHDLGGQTPQPQDAVLPEYWGADTAEFYVKCTGAGYLMIICDHETANRYDIRLKEPNKYDGTTYAYLNDAKLRKECNDTGIFQWCGLVPRGTLVEFYDTQYDKNQLSNRTFQGKKFYVAIQSVIRNTDDV